MQKESQDQTLTVEHTTKQENKEKIYGTLNLPILEAMQESINHI